MLFRRIALGSLCAVTAAGMVFAADNRNPFAEWDRLKQKTGVTESQDAGNADATKARRSGSSLEYFSANAAPKKPAEETPKTERRRLTMIDSIKDADEPPVPPLASPNVQPLGELAFPEVSTTGVVQAAASETLAEQSKPTIQQIAAEISEDSALTEDNPFADFILEEPEADSPDVGVRRICRCRCLPHHEHIFQPTRR